MFASFPKSIPETLKPYFVREERTYEGNTCDIYDVSSYDFYTNRGIYVIRIVYADVYLNDGLEIITIQSFDAAGRNHGSWYYFDHDCGLMFTTTTIYHHGDRHNERGWARMENDFGDFTKKYYLDDKLVSRDALEVKQRAAIIELLPQPIWEEVLEHYAIEV